MMLVSVTEIVVQHYYNRSNTKERGNEEEKLCKSLYLTKCYPCRLSWKGWAELFIPTSMQGLNVML